MNTPKLFIIGMLEQMQYAWRSENVFWKYQIRDWVDIDGRHIEILCGVNTMIPILRLSRLMRPADNTNMWEIALQEICMKGLIFIYQEMVRLYRNNQIENVEGVPYKENPLTPAEATEKRKP